MKQAARTTTQEGGTEDEPQDADTYRVLSDSRRRGRSADGRTHTRAATGSAAAAERRVWTAARNRGDGRTDASRDRRLQQEVRHSGKWRGAARGDGRRLQRRRHAAAGHGWIDGKCFDRG